jgi:hypothetical protein
VLKEEIAVGLEGVYEGGGPGVNDGSNRSSVGVM